MKPGQRSPQVWLFAGIALGLVTLAAYWPVLRCGFINYDDPEYVTANPVVQNGLTLHGVAWAFSNPVSANWHPLTMLSHMLDCQCFGLNPQGHHLTSLVLHIVNTLLLFVFLGKLTGAMWRSLFVAALFGLHPLHVESVAWISERKDVLSACLGLLSLMFYCRYARKTSQPAQTPAPDYLLAFLLLALGLLCKPMLVTWPFVMLLLDYWPLGRFQSASAWPLFREKIPLFALVIVSSIVTYLVQQHEGAMMLGEKLPLAMRAENAVVSYVSYLEKFVWPAGLAILYPYAGAWPAWTVFIAGALLAAISALVWAGRRRQPFLLMGWLWYCGTLVPVIGLVQVGAQAMADRYLYLPSVGILVLVVWGASELVRHRRGLAFALSAAGVVVLLLSFALTWRQLAFWRDSETLFRHTLAVTRDNYYAHNNLGNALYAQGRLAEAIGEYQEALRLKPDYAECHNNLAGALDAQGQIDAAIGEFQEAIRYRPTAAEIHHGLGMELAKAGRIDEAILELQESIRLKPGDAGAHNDLGNALDRQGRTDEAIVQYQEAIRLDPAAAEAHGNLGAALGKKGRFDEAIPELQAALRLKPDDPSARYNLAAAFYEKGQTNEAVSQLQEALRLQPDFAGASNLLLIIGAHQH